MAAVDVADLLADLTDEQRLAVTHGEGPLLILAGAGSGKTRVITRRVAYLLRQGVKPGNILAITFTNKAAGEMRQRIEALIPGHRVIVSTFHSLGARLLRQYADRLQIHRDFTIYDVDDRNKLIKEAMDSAGIDLARLTPDRIGGAISKAKNQLLTPKDYELQANDFFTQTVARVYPIYQKKLRAANAMDFDDLLYLPAMAVKLNEEFRRDLDQRFQYVLIDEYQDTNLAQYEFAKRLSQDYPNLCVVGDPDQSIYRWRGSDIRNILDFERDFPNAKVITLARNYRSTKAILAAADSLIRHNTQRKKKPLITENEQGEPVRVLTFDHGLEEAESVVRRIKDQVQAGRARYRDHAIFLRVNALSRSLESAFIQHGVPFQIVRGLAFFERKENKDVLAYLRLLVNPWDSVCFLRVVNEPARGIGKVSLDRLVRYAEEKGIGLLEAAGQVAAITDIRGKAATGLRDFHRLIMDLRSALTLPPHEVIQQVLERTGYRAMLAESSHEDDVERLANVDEMVTAARQFHQQSPDATLADFLEQVALTSDVDSWDDAADHVSVMTLHAAKGLEFPIVYILAVEQGLLPHERSLHKAEDIEEERRLCFVGMTRAKKELYLCHARVRDVRGQSMYAIPSTFLDELPREVEHVDYSAVYRQRPSAADEWRGRVNERLEHASATPAPRTTPQNDSPYSIGQVVIHDSYGVGHVKDVTGYGALRRIKVRFVTAGEKTFVADKAKLKVIC